MPLSWNEIRSRAIAFSKDWSDAARERSEAQTFWNEFFQVFGINRRTVASFEEPVRNLGGQFGFIDLFWKATLIAEHKSRGRDLGKAHLQAIDYIHGLHSDGRGDEVPRYIVASDFARIALHDLESGEPPVEFPLTDLHQHIHRFGFIAGYSQRVFEEQDPLNLQAVRLMGRLHDALEDGGYPTHDLERLLVRVLFCLFAEDSGIFDQPDTFRRYVEDHTAADGSDLGLHLARMFDVLNTPHERRQGNLREELAELPYVNGDLFAERLSFADFNRDMRNALLACTRFTWRDISPAVFGSMFQAVMEPRERRQEGAHYTSERDILKLIRSLFLDDLEQELAAMGGDRRRLAAFQRKLGTIHVFDPACGCGSFLVIAYRELRRLEIETLKRIAGGERQQLLDVKARLHVDVDQMYGIELGEWPARIAEVALWLMDHQMNQLVSAAFGESVLRLPLEKAPTITLGNALRIDWREVLAPEKCSYILGNPPFVGAKYQSDEQRSDVRAAASGVRNVGLLDYVTGWYFKAADYVREAQAKGREVPVAFVSTNSITQGEQVGVLWSELYRRGMKIRFGHRTFAWQSEAERPAHVHVVIVGFGTAAPSPRRIYDYETGSDTAAVSEAANISPYLVDVQNAESTLLVNRSRAICPSPSFGIGNKPIDDGQYLFTPEEKAEFLQREPSSEPYFRRWLGSREFLNGVERWCLWVGDCPPAELRRMPEVMRRVENVRDFRRRSRSRPTQELANRPTRFHVENFPNQAFLLVPKVSSERRRYIPMGWIDPAVIASDLVFISPDATLYHFAVLTSNMHMAWARTVCGRLESRYRYSKKLVYNNFPWPDEPDGAKRQAVEATAKAVLEARAEHPDATLADLYDPLSMPRNLARAHTTLDRLVDRLYRSAAFASDQKRVEHLFERYERLTAPLTPTRRRRRS